MRSHSSMRRSPKRSPVPGGERASVQGVSRPFAARPFGPLYLSGTTVGAHTEPIDGGATPPRLLYRSLLDVIRDLSGTAKRFWVLVLLTGAAAGLGAVLLVDVLRWVQHVAW